MRENADRFEGLAESYEMHAPGYPQAAFDDLAALSPAEPRIAVDVGAGTGNATAALRGAVPQGSLVVAVEPGRDMRRVLSRRFSDCPNVQVMDASAEALPLPASSASVIVAASALRWFARDVFFDEAARVLAPRGTLALVRNRLQQTPLSAALDAYVAERGGEPTEFGAHDRTGDPSLRDLATLADFTTAKSRSYDWTSIMDLRGVIDMYLTSPALGQVVRRIGLKQVMTDLTAIGAGVDGPIHLSWQTGVKWMHRRG